MTGGMAPDTIFYALLLILPIAALLARRVPFLRVIAMLGAWAAIFVVGLVLIGQRERIEPLWERVSALLQLDDQKVVGSEVRIRMAADGHFWARATIDGVSRRMLIDSGATITALSSDTASQARLEPRATPFPTILHTANGDIVAKTASVRTLHLGDITARDLSVVVSPAFGNIDVLGMNFLSRLKSWRVEGRTLILVPHHPQSFT